MKQPLNLGKRTKKGAEKTLGSKREERSKMDRGKNSFCSEEKDKTSPVAKLKKRRIVGRAQTGRK